MRAFEFKLYENATVPANEILAKAKKSPEALDKAIKGIEAINDAAHKYIELTKEKDTKTAQPKTNAVKPIIPPSQQTQAPPVESLDEAQENSIEKLRQELNSNADLTKYLKLQASKGDKTAAKLVKEMETKAKELNKLLDEAVKYAEFTQRKARRAKEVPAITELAAKVTGTLEAIEEHYKKQAELAKNETGEEATEIVIKEAPALNAVTEEIVTIMDGTLEGLRDNPKTADDYNNLNELILKFLQASKVGVVPLGELLTKGSGNIIDEVDDGKWGTLKDNGFIQKLMAMKPAGSGAGKWGPGEVGIAVLGSPVNKMGKGDLDVGGRKFELKASASPKSGGRINASKAIKTGTDAKSEFIKAWESFSSNIDIVIKGNEIVAREGDVKKGSKKIKLTSIGITWVNIVNAALARSQKTPSELGAFLQDILRAPINDDYKNAVKFNSSRMISNEDGKPQINGAGLLSEYIGECMKLYNKTDGVGDILVINPTDGHFEIINALDKAGIEAKLSSGAIQTSTTWIDFDDVMLATPQLGTITPK